MLYKFLNSKRECLMSVNNTCENKNYHYYVFFLYPIVYRSVCEIISCTILSSFFPAFMYVYVHPYLGIIKCRLFVDNTCEYKNYKQCIVLLYYIIYTCTCKETVLCRDHPGSGRVKCGVFANNYWEIKQ